MASAHEPASDHTPIYNVKAAAQRAGLSPITLRAWERRYGLPAPQRNSHGYRLYSEYDLRTLRWLKAQLETGLSISRATGWLAELRAAGQDPAHAAPAVESNLLDIEAPPLTSGDPAPSAWVLDVNHQPLELSTLWHSAPTLLVFLRHFGCIFCRELLGKLNEHQSAISAAGLKVALIGLGNPEQAQQVCGQLVPGALCLSNPSASAYTAFGFKRGGLLQLAGPQVMSAAVRAARSGYVQGETTGDIAVLGGLFIIDPPGRIRHAYYSRYAGDNPDLTEIIHLNILPEA